MEAELNILIVGDRTPGPGPADHVDKSHFGEGPKCSMRPRHPENIPRLDPALVNLKSTLGQAPKYSLSSRHPEPKKFNPPGPNYVPPAFGANAPRVGFTRARVTQKIVKSPGPADYTPSPRSVNAFGTNSTRVGIREGGPRRLWDPTFSPGPANYLPSNPARSSSPRWTIAHKYKEKAKDRTGEYIAAKTTLGGCKYTMPHSGRPEIRHH